jgi:hypothetical protein
MTWIIFVGKLLLLTFYLRFDPDRKLIEVFYTTFMTE